MIKYLWSAAGYGLIAVPLLFTRTHRSLGTQTDSSEQARKQAKDNAVAGRTESACHAPMAWIHFVQNQNSN